MQQIGIDAIEVVFVLISSWLGSQTKKSQLYQFVFLGLLCLGSLYIGWYGLNLISPQMAKVSFISAASRQGLMIAFSVTAVVSGLLLLPSTQRILARATSWKLSTPQQILGAWLFVILLALNTGFLLATSSSIIALLANGAGAGTTPLNVLANALSYLFIAVIGIELSAFRPPRALFERLGLTRLQDPFMTVLVVVVLSGIVILAGLIGGIWVKKTDASMFQTLQFSLNTLLPLAHATMLQAILFACFFGVLAGISQEVLFRGLLQPTFGLVPTALLFTALHSQLGFSPALLLIFVLSIGCGWLRARYSTWAAILAHMLTTSTLVFLWWVIMIH